MTKYSIPHSNSTTSLVQTFDTNTTLRSEFQLKTLKEISEKEEFKQFILMNNIIIVDPDYKDPFNCLWFDVNGKLHLTKIGRVKVLKDIVIN